MTSDETVIVHGSFWRDATTGFAVSIEAGCNGFAAATFLAADIVAFPASMKHMVFAILVGSFFLKALNIVPVSRVLSGIMELQRV